MRTASILAALSVAASAALAAPAGFASAESPTETIGLLEAQGYTVNVDRIGNAPTDECVVTSVRNPQTVTKLVRVERHSGRHDHRDDDSGGGDGRGSGKRDKDYDLVEVVVSRSISVSLDCAT